MSKSNFVVENGKAFYVSRNNKKVELDISVEVVSQLKPASEVKAPETRTTPTTAPAVAVKATPAFENKGHAEINPMLLGRPGVLKGDNKLFYLVCVHCGMLTSKAQAKFSIERNGKVECIYCQRRIRAGHGAYKAPEHDSTKIRDAYMTKFSKELAEGKKLVDLIPKCQGTDCKTLLSNGHIAVALAVTGGKFRLCTTCLQKYAGTKVPQTAAPKADPKPAAVASAASAPVDDLPMFDPDLQ